LEAIALQSTEVEKGSIAGIRQRCSKEEVLRTLPDGWIPISWLMWVNQSVELVTLP